MLVYSDATKSTQNDIMERRLDVDPRPPRTSRLHSRGPTRWRLVAADDMRCCRCNGRLCITGYMLIVPRNSIVLDEVLRRWPMLLPRSSMSKERYEGWSRSRPPLTLRRCFQCFNPQGMSHQLVLQRQPQILILQLVRFLRSFRRLPRH